ncbi:MAG TPA: DUF5372 family protein [Chloroflexota bacterium]|nr:DUF5372 family protein [Chloroflexota bacterium]
MRIIHPNHPLTGKTAVVKRVSHASHRQPARILISHPQTGTITIPQAWVTPVADEKAALAAVPNTTAVPPVTAHTLLVLAKLVQSIQTPAPEENCHAQPIAPQATTPQSHHLAEPAARPAAGTHQPAGHPAAPISGQPATPGDQPPSPKGETP